MTSHGAPENDDCYGASARQKSSSSARSGPLTTSGNPVFWSKTTRVQDDAADRAIRRHPGPRPGR